MDTVGTFEMAKVLTQSKLITALHKHYTVAQHVEFIKENPACKDFVAFSSGISDDDFKAVVQVLSLILLSAAHNPF
jgi:GMP reductase